MSNRGWGVGYDDRLKAYLKWLKNLEQPLLTNHGVDFSPRTVEAAAEHFDVSTRTIVAWRAELRKRGELA